MSIEADLRALVRDMVKTEVIPVLMAELRAMEALAPARQSEIEVFTVGEVAAAMKVSEPTVLEWIKRGHLRAAKLPNGREWRIQRSELEKLMVAPPSTPAPPVKQLVEREVARIMSLPQSRVGGSGG